MLCSFGCDQPATFYFKSTKRWCCDNQTSRCPEVRRKNSEANAGKAKKQFRSYVSWSKGKTKDSCAILAVKAQKALGKAGTFNGRIHTQEAKDKISAKLKGNTNGSFRTDRQIRYKGIRFDSRWEVGVAYYFDQNNIQWKYSERSYKLQNGCYYYPDFHVYDSNGTLDYILEVKGFLRSKNASKLEMFKNEYPLLPFRVWFRDTLKQLGIIDSGGAVKNLTAILG